MYVATRAALSRVITPGSIFNSRPFSFVVLLSLFEAFGLAQNSGGPGAIPPFDPPTIYTPTRLDTYTSYCGLWRTDGTFESTIRLSNQLVISPIDATVTLYLADGTAYALPAVHLLRSGVATVNVNAALAAAPQSIAAHMSTFGSAAVSYNYDWQGVVYATMSILDVPRSLQYTYPFMFPMTVGSGGMNHASQGVIEGMHWGYGKRSTAFFSFANTSGQAVDVSMSVLDDGGAAHEQRRFTVPPKNTVLQTLAVGTADPVNGATHGGPLGGIRINHNAEGDSLNVLGGIEDDDYGYSATCPLSSPPDESTMQMPGNPVTQTFASPGLMVGAQDPMMGFPSSLRFKPYAYVRNMMGGPLQVTARAIYSSSGQSQTITLPAVALPPHGAAELPLQDQIQNLNGSITLVWSYQGPLGALATATGSVDQNGDYVFAVEARSVGQSASKSSVYWTTANGFDTMYSLWNPINQPEDLLLRFQYGDKQSYVLPVHLGGSGSAMVDVKELMVTGTPDIHGQVLPAAAQEGSLVILSASGKEVDPITVVVSGGIYNPQNGTCGNTCETCNGCTGFDISPNPFNGTVSVFRQLYSQCPWYNGTINDYTTSSQWSSGNTGVVTIQTKGNSQPGLANPLGAGSTTGYAEILGFLPLNSGQICTQGTLPPCPTTQNPTPSTPVKVAPTVTIQVEQYKQLGSAGFVLLGSDQATTNLTAAGTPSGGTYSWTVGPELSIAGPANGVNMSLKGTSPSTSYSDTWAQVVYTVSGQSATASIRFTVRDPRQLNAGTLGGPGSTVKVNQTNQVGYITWITYFVQDQLNGGQTISVPGINSIEVLTTLSENYLVEFNPPSGTPATAQTNQVGTFLDELSATDAPPGVPSNFSASRSQQFTISGSRFSTLQTQSYGPTYATISKSTLTR